MDDVDEYFKRYKAVHPDATLQQVMTAYLSQESVASVGTIQGEEENPTHIVVALPVEYGTSENPKGGWTRGYFWNVFSDLRLRPNDKLVYVVICIHANNDTQQAFISAKTISDLSGVSLRQLHTKQGRREGGGKRETIEGVLPRLLRLGYIDIDKKVISQKGSTTQVVNVYTVMDKPEFHVKRESTYGD